MTASGDSYSASLRNWTEILKKAKEGGIDGEDLQSGITFIYVIHSTLLYFVSEDTSPLLSW